MAEAEKVVLDEPPPFLGTWGRVYRFVLRSLRDATAERLSPDPRGFTECRKFGSIRACRRRPS